MLNGSMMMTNNRVITSQGVGETSKYGDYLRGTMEIAERSISTIRAKTPSVENSNALKKQRTFDQHHATKASFYVTKHNKGQSKNTANLILSGDTLPLKINSNAQVNSTSLELLT